MTILMKTLTTAAFAGLISMGSFAQDSAPTATDKKLDPMKKAELRCETMRLSAKDGSDEDKALAEQKCERAMAWAKEKMAKDAKPAKVPSR